MTLDEAIEHHEWAMLESDGQVAEEHFQYVEWLLELKRHQAAWDLSCKNAREAILESDALRAENARYRELVEILRRDWHIEASWDGLRKFWYVGLTEDGVRERDERDAKALEAANIEIGELRELVRDMFMTFCTFRETAMTDREELRHSVRFWKKLDRLGIEVSR